MFFGSSITSIFRPLVACIALLAIYQTLIFNGFISSSEGINQWQTNVIKAQEYAYSENLNIDMVLVGSSLTNNLPFKDMGSQVVNLGMSGGSTQTGLEIVKRKKSKPRVLLVELNDTIDRTLDKDLVDPLYNPFWSFVKFYFPMFRQEYRPTSVLVQYLKDKYKKNVELMNEQQDKEQITQSDIRKKMVKQIIKERSIQLTHKHEELLKQQAEYIKAQILEIQKEGTRVILVDIPGEPLVDNTIRQKQVRELLQLIFPSNFFEWLPKPSKKDWVTSDGIHLVRADAKEYVLFIKRATSSL